MNILSFIFWAFIGVVLAMVVLSFQRWSVYNIHPARPRRSNQLIIGGAIIRWLLIALIFIISGFHNYYSLITVFISFMVFRGLKIAKWQESFNANRGHVH